MKCLALVLGAVVCAAACDQGPRAPLAQAAVRNDAAAIKQLLANGHTADERENGAWTALIWATRAGALDAMKALLDGGADINLPGSSGDNWDATPLQHAILERQTSAAQLLIDRGADVNRSAGPKLVAPIFLAAGDTDPTILKSLLARGADARIEDENGATPLARAVSAGSLHGPDRPMFGGCRVETVRTLIAYDPQMRLKDNDAAKNALWWARFQRCREVLTLVNQ